MQLYIPNYGSKFGDCFGVCFGLRSPPRLDANPTINVPNHDPENPGHEDPSDARKTKLGKPPKALTMWPPPMNPKETQVVGEDEEDPRLFTQEDTRNAEPFAESNCISATVLLTPHAEEEEQATGVVVLPGTPSGSLGV